MKHEESHVIRITWGRMNRRMFYFRRQCTGERVKVWVVQSCLTLWDPMEYKYGLSGSSVYGILQARILEGVAIPFFRGSSWTRDWTQVSCIAGRFFTVWAPREAQCIGAPKSLQSCLTLCDPIDRSPPDSSVLGILRAKILEWVAISFSSV